MDQVIFCNQHINYRGTYKNNWKGIKYYSKQINIMNANQQKSYNTQQRNNCISQDFTVESAVTAPHCPLVVPMQTPEAGKANELGEQRLWIRIPAILKAPSGKGLGKSSGSNRKDPSGPGTYLSSQGKISGFHFQLCAEFEIKK